MSEAHEVIVAAFDLDGTLADGGSVFKWLRHVGGNTATWGAATQRVFPLGWGALRSGDAADRAKESLFRAVLHGRDVDEIDEMSAAFAQRHLDKHGRPQYLERLAWHLAEGHRVVVVSASPENYVRAVATLVGAEAGLATRLAVDPLGRLTGGYLGKNCRGDEKQRRLSEWVSTHVGESVELYAYGNSRGDRRMLQGADFAFDAGKLGKLGAMRSFERLSTP